MQRQITVRHLFGVALLGCMVAALFGAKPLAAWVDTSPLSGTVIQQVADTWRDVAERTGLTRPYETLHIAVRQFEAMRFAARD
jgi:hypothetical protein